MKTHHTFAFACCCSSAVLRAHLFDFSCRHQTLSGQMMGFSLFLKLSFVSYAAFGNQVVIIGDSWGTKGASELQAVFKEHGASWEISNYAIAGTTTADWVKDPNKMLDAINENPDAEFVWMTLSGNDAAHYLPGCTAKYPLPNEKCIKDVLNESISNIEMMLDPVFKQHPNIQVVQFGYDLMNFKKGICWFEGRNVMHGCNDDALCVNTQFIKIQEGVDYLATQYANYTSINLLGSLQLMDRSIPNVCVSHKYQKISM